jgi:ubiquinone/menaquinone biosynthesis C-methylase UbiE
MTYYDDIAKGYEELHGEEQEKKIALIRQHLVIHKTDKLLDVGCGSGLTTRVWDCDRTGIDPARKLIEKAQKSDPEGVYIVAPAEDIPFPAATFDVVLSITALQNFEEYQKGLQEMKRVAKDDARFVISFLRRSDRADVFASTILANFKVHLILKEEKDTIFFI